MTPTWHPPEDVLLEHATGAAAEMVSLLTATHLALCPDCRATAQALDLAGGLLMGALTPIEVDAPPPEITAPPEARPAPPVSAGDLPQPLRGLVGGEITWKKVVPGMEQLELTAAGPEGSSLRLMRFAPGFTISEHAHEGLELGLILSGGAEDERGAYLRGDVTVRDVREPHALRVHSDDPCVVLIANLAPIQPTGLVARLMFRWLGL